MPTFDNALILHDLPIMQSSYQYNNAFKYQNPKIQIHRNRNRNTNRNTNTNTNLNTKTNTNTNYTI